MLWLCNEVRKTDLSNDVDCIRGLFIKFDEEFVVEWLRAKAANMTNCFRSREEDGQDLPFLCQFVPSDPIDQLRDRLLQAIGRGLLEKNTTLDLRNKNWAKRRARPSAGASRRTRP